MLLPSFSSAATIQFIPSITALAPRRFPVLVCVGNAPKTTPELSPDFLSIRNLCRRRQQHLARDQPRNRCHHFAERVHIRALLASTSTALRRNTGSKRRKEEGIRARKWHLRRGVFQWGGRDLQAMSMTPSEVGTHKLEVPHRPQRR